MCRVSVAGGEMAQPEIDAYIAHARERYGRTPDEMHIELDGEFVNIDVHFYSPFARIRRITGYLVGTVDRFNDGKRAEERDRVKHRIA
jgi:hypothetical protein